MLAFLRLLQILTVFFKFRLDTLLAGLPLPWWLRLLCFCCRILPAPRKPRGERLREALQQLGPVYIKFGQLLSTRPDLIPADMVKQLDQLQDRVPPFASAEFVGVVENALGNSIDRLFADFEREPLASASVAQVHAATLPTGEQVVVKAIRPGIEGTIEKDVSLMELLASLVDRFVPDGKRLRAREVVAEYRYTIFNELNLQRESANATQLRRNFAQSNLLYVPRIYWDLVRRNVMVMERIHGVQVTDIEALNAAGTDMKILAERGVKIFFTQVFEHNFFHADMHPGNVYVDTSDPADPNYIALDMAIVTSLNDEDQYYLARNLLAMFRRDYRLVAELHVISGWVKEDTNINEFEAAIRTVCEPIFEKPLKDISFGQVVVTLFQTAARFEMTVQPQLVLLQKTLLNIEGLGRQLYPELDLWTTAHPFLEHWLKNRFHPRSLWKQLKRYGPEWMEKFPEIPNLVYAGLQQINQLDRTRPFPAEQNPAPAPRPARRTVRWLGTLALGAGVWLGWPQLGGSLTEMPAVSLLLLGAGTIAWLTSL